MTNEEIFLKHYEMQRTALNEIKELINTYPNRPGMTAEELLIEIENVADYASRVDLTNPIRLDESRKYIANQLFGPEGIGYWVEKQKRSPAS